MSAAKHNASRDARRMKRALLAVYEAALSAALSAGAPECDDLRYVAALAEPFVHPRTRRRLGHKYVNVEGGK